MTEAALVEGQVKLRDGKKWKSRWLVLRKPSPVAGVSCLVPPADCLLMLAYKDRSERTKGLRERSSLTLEDICGLEPGLPYEGLAHTLAIVCLSQAVMLGFDSREAMCAWDARIRYALGEDPSLGGPATVEERVAQEALEALQLEKRLSLLSHSVRTGSGGDDRSLCSSSSEASRSDISTSSQLTAWPEQSWSSAGTSQEGPGLGAAQVPGEVVLGASRPPPKPLRPRQLQEVGRQSSADSGIATGSRSSCSGSFSSGADSSLDMWRSGDEFGSLLSLPLAAGAPEPSLCACPPGTAEYQVPTALRPHYDSPRSLCQAPRDQTPAAQGGPAGGGAGDSGSQVSVGCPSSWLGARQRGQETEAAGSEATPPSPAPGEPWEAGGPHAELPPAFFAACPVCGGLKVKPPP
ncbi:protein Dok-7 isoform X6 [Manis javanica]|uniref:protein Dok-7 isoform X6 n=1 Tax=Manis javanica TaxID=9974 RepID=UPI003C6D07DE